MDNSSNGIFEELASSGILDNTVPGAQFVIGAEISAKPFGMARVRVLIGVVVDLLSKNLTKLSRP